MLKSERFGLILSPAEKQALLRLAERERISAAAVVRRLIWNAAQHVDAKSRENESLYSNAAQGEVLS